MNNRPNIFLFCINLEYAPGNVLISNEFYYNDEDRHDIASGHIPDNVLNLSKLNYSKLLLALFLIGFFGNGIFPGTDAPISKITLSSDKILMNILLTN